MFPRLTFKITPDKQLAEKRFLVKKLRLELDKSICRNCGVCYNVCPNDVIKKGAPGASVKNPDNQMISGVVLDPDTCSYCGVCQHMCPFGALQLFVDDEPVPDEDLQIIIKNALPTLVTKEIKLKDGKTGNQYMDGHLEYSEEKCLSGCRTCVQICPTESLSFQKREPWERGEKFVIDRDSCMYCGACAYSCPTGAIKIFRDKVDFEGEFNDPFWPNIQKKLLDFHSSM